MVATATIRTDQQGLEAELLDLAIEFNRRLAVTAVTGGVTRSVVVDVDRDPATGAACRDGVQTDLTSSSLAAEVAAEDFAVEPAADSYCMTSMTTASERQILSPSVVPIDEMLVHPIGEFVSSPLPIASRFGSPRLLA